MANPCTVVPFLLQHLFCNEKVPLKERWPLLREIIYNYTISIHLKSGLIRGEAFGKMALIREMAFGQRGLIREMAFGQRGLIREMASLEGNNLLLYNLYTSEIWSDKRGSLWREGSYKTGGLSLGGQFTNIQSLYI